MRLKPGFIAVVCVLISLRPAPAVELERLWTLEGFANPESVALAADGQELYVTNVAGEATARNGEGFVSRVSLDGEILETRWAVGLDAPKGIDRRGERLFVSDIDRLVEIDASTGQVLARTQIPDAAFLNDVEVLDGGGVLVSDSGTARIYRVQGQGVTIWAEGDWLAGANGLLAEHDRLLVTTMGTGRLYSYDRSVGRETVLAEAIGNGDGVVALGDGNYLVTEWPGRLFYVASDGGMETVLDTRDAGIYLNDHLLVGDVLYVPNWEPGTLTAYRVIQD